MKSNYYYRLLSITLAIYIILSFDRHYFYKPRSSPLYVQVSKAFGAWMKSPLTWSWTSVSQSSRHSRFSKGLKSASLKWKWGDSTWSLRIAAIESWMHSTAFFEMPRSLWQAASMKCGPRMLQTLMMWIRGRPLFTHFSITCEIKPQSFSCLLFSSLLKVMWSTTLDLYLIGTLI